MTVRAISSRARLALPAATLAASLPAIAMAQEGTPAASPEASPMASPAASPAASPVASASGLDWAAVAEEQWAFVQDRFAVTGTGLFREHSPEKDGDRQYSYLWPYAGFLSGAVGRARLGASDAAPEMIAAFQALEEYFDPSVQPVGYDSYVQNDGGGDKFYDDNEWLGIDFVHAFHLTGEQMYLDKAILTWEFALSGWTEQLGGGIHWKQYDMSTKNTCSNGPAAVLGLMLHEATGDQAYLDRSVAILDWLKVLKDEAHDVYWDNIHVEGRIDETTWTYNTGTPMQANALLYGITGERTYLDEARALAAGSWAWFAPDDEAVDGVRMLPATPWFNAVLLRGYLALAAVDPEPDWTYVNGFLAAAEHGWRSARDETGAINPDWSGREAAPAEAAFLDQASFIEIATLAALIGTSS